MIAIWNLPVVKLSITVFILIKWQSWLFERFYLQGLSKPRETHIDLRKIFGKLDLRPLSVDRIASFPYFQC